MVLDHVWVRAPFAGVTAVAGGGALRAVEFGDEAAVMTTLRRRHPEATWRSGGEAESFAGLLERYLEGDLEALGEAALAPAGTPFQRRVWDEVRRLPAGRTTTYGEIARRLGEPGAMRAVGHANGSNPIPLFIPCHRVVGAGGRLTGYGGGLHIKRWLLGHENARPPEGVGTGPTLFRD
jgi:methylated-DNA-[protein]-cysteine S-methyltransferase